MSLKPDFGYIPAGAAPLLPNPEPFMKWYGNRFRLFWDGYMLVSYFSIDESREMFDWMVDNVAGSLKIINRPYGVRPGDQIQIFEKSQMLPGELAIHFRNKEDAMAFKLRWA